MDDHKAISWFTFEASEINYLGKSVTTTFLIRIMVDTDFMHLKFVDDRGQLIPISIFDSKKIKDY